MEEWEIVRDAIPTREFLALVDFRALASSLDCHAACGATPHSQRAATLLRFLRARGGTLRRALALLKEALDWRRDFEIDSKLEAWEREWAEGVSPRVRLLKAYDYLELLGKDRDGLSVFLQREAVADVGGLVREVGQDVVVLHLLRTVELQMREAQELMLRRRRLLMSFVELHDLALYAHLPSYMDRAWSCVPVYMSLARVLDKVYPERVRKVFILRPPRAFSFIWRIVQPVIPPNTKLKISITGRTCNSYLPEMEALLPPETIPAWLRSDDLGLGETATPAGGIVPRGALAAFASGER